MKTVKLPGPASTLAVMDYADANPDVEFDYTHFKFDYGVLVVSEDTSDEFYNCVEEGLYKMYKLPNGWERYQTLPGAWNCRKGDRKLFITG